MEIHSKSWWHVQIPNKAHRAGGLWPSGSVQNHRCPSTLPPFIGLFPVILFTVCRLFERASVCSVRTICMCYEGAISVKTHGFTAIAVMENNSCNRVFFFFFFDTDCSDSVYQQKWSQILLKLEIAYSQVFMLEVPSVMPRNV